jgi:TRAP-type C4-dicarboxylate transport system permease large subunit
LATFSALYQPLLPFFASMIGVLLVTTFVPWISLVLPRLFGLC